MAPEVLDFGEVGLGAVKTRTLLLSNRGSEPLGFEVTAGAPFTIAYGERGSLGPGETLRAEVQLAADTEGPVEGALAIDSDDPDSPTLRVPLTATARRLPPCTYAVVPARVGLGAVAIGDMRSAPVRVENGAATPCHLSETDLSVRGSGDFTLAAGRRGVAVPLPPASPRRGRRTTSGCVWRLRAPGTRRAASTS